MTSEIRLQCTTPLRFPNLDCLTPPMSQDRTNPLNIEERYGEGEGGTSERKGGNEDSETECRTSSRHPTLRSRTEQQLWAFRRYHGIGPGGASVEEWTQQEIADVLGVSRQTVEKWLNREDIAASFLGHLTLDERSLLYFLTVYGEREDLEEYLALISLERRSRRGEDAPVDEDDDHHFLEGFEEESLW